MKKITKKGFTLIELMVVMAIIGGLSTMAFIYLQGARDKGSDTAIRSVLTGLMSLAETHFDNSGGTYTGLCSYVSAVCTGTPTGVNAKICAAAERIKKDNGVAYPSCAANATNWAISSQLKSDSGVKWCVNDGLENRKTTTGGNVSTAGVCP